MLLLPVLILVLWYLWMKAVESTRKEGLPVQAMDIGEAYQEAIIQDS